MHLVYKKSLLPTSWKNKTSDSVRDLDVLATKPRDTKTESPPCQGQNAQQNTNQRKNQGRKRKGNSLLSFNTNTWKREKNTGGGRGGSFQQKSAVRLWGQINKIGRTGFRLGIFAVSITEVIPKLDLSILNCPLSANTTQTPLPHGVFLLELWLTDNPSESVGGGSGLATLSRIQLLMPVFSFPNGSGE